jgi:hypothetical protein
MPDQKSGFDPITTSGRGCWKPVEKTKKSSQIEVKFFQRNHWCPNVEATNSYNLLKMFIILTKRLVFDLKVWPKNAYNPPADKFQEELSNEYRPNCFFADHRLSSHALISKLCKTVSRKPENKILYLLRSIHVHGFRPDDISRKPSGYRSLPHNYG